MKSLLSSKLICSICILIIGGSIDLNAQVSDLQNWLSIPFEERPPLETQPFARQPISRIQSDSAAQLLYIDHQARIEAEYGNQWDNRILMLNKFEMPFYYQVFGDQPADGRSLFISLHGGGGTTATVNDQQYQNQQHLYDAVMNSLEGVYLAPRAPTNTWNMWHQGHIDALFNLLIQLAVIKENVNPNKVYLLGYSAGGDGVYQLAPRMADRWAAASMMAGHPNDASPLGLRNTPFAIHVGALDDAYNRNGIAEQWGAMLDSLQNVDHDGYIHDVKLHAGLGHWMNLEDAVALPWMKNYSRNPIPQKLVWKQNSTHHSEFYWLKTPAHLIETNGEIRARYEPSLNTINILENYSDTIQLYVHDDMLDLDQPVNIQYQGTSIFTGQLHRSTLNVYETMSEKGDPNQTFATVLSVIQNQNVVEENIDLAVGIGQVSGQNFIDSLYPIPSDDFLHLNFSSIPLKVVQIVISDIQGRTVKRIETSQKKNKIFVGDLGSGTYMLTVEMEGNKAAYQIVKN
jgi:hypothetical protein